MAALVNQSFANTFDFSRSVTATYRNAAGVEIIAAVDDPRFDHDVAGTRLGLIVGPGPKRGAQDIVSVKAGAWEVLGAATVLLEWEEGGEIRRRAIYTTQVRSTVNACLNIIGHYRKIGAVAGYLPNLGEPFEGHVKFANASWPLGSALAAGFNSAIGTAAGQALIESS